MAAIIKDLGVATAYGYAKSKGYTGTEEEFAELMASYATVAETAVVAKDAAVVAQGKAEDAEENAEKWATGSTGGTPGATNNAEYYAGQASDSATTASTKAGEASGSANTASQKAIAASGSADVAAADALKAEGYAQGKQNGTDVGSGSPYYHANAKYYSEQASGSATTAGNEATAASGSASTAGEKALVAEGYAVGKQNGTDVASGSPYFENNAKHYAEKAEEFAESIDPDTLAKIDGYYEQMTVGNAEQLVSTVGITDKVPYNFRTSGGSADIGDRMVDKIVGGTVAWNQLVQNGNFVNTGKWYRRNTTHVTSMTASDNTLTMTFNSGSASAGRCAYQTLGGTIGINHIVLLSCDVCVPGDKAYLHFGLNDINENPAENRLSYGVSSDGFERASTIIKLTKDVSYAAIGTRSATTNLSVTMKLRNVQVIDLTQMFGSTIADYIFSLKSSSTAEAVAYVRKLFPKRYYAYNAGELMSVKALSHDTVGFNAYDNATGKAKVIGGMEYQITGAYTALTLDGETITPDASGFFTTAKSGEMTVTGGNGTTTCIHLVWDGERNGEYEPYVKRSYPLGNVELRGIPKLDANNSLYYDGDEYTDDGTVTRKYGIVDLGTLTWLKSGSANRFYSDTLDGTIKKASAMPGITAPIENIACSNYAADNGYNGYNGINDMRVSTCYFNSKTFVQINDQTKYSSLTAEQFKTAMSGVYLVYELATPTTESADAFQNPQIVDDFGTEEYVDRGVSTSARDVSIPVGHETVYQPNLRAKLEMSPDSPAGDGDYIVRQSNGENTYVPLVIPAELPTTPGEDGTYVLKVTVSSGTPTLSWVSE